MQHVTRSRGRGRRRKEELRRENCFVDCSLYAKLGLRTEAWCSIQGVELKAREDWWTLDEPWKLRKDWSKEIWELKGLIMFQSVGGLSMQIDKKKKNHEVIVPPSREQEHSIQWLLDPTRGGGETLRERLDWVASGHNQAVSSIEKRF